MAEDVHEGVDVGLAREVDARAHVPLDGVDILRERREHVHARVLLLLILCALLTETAIYAVHVGVRMGGAPLETRTSIYHAHNVAAVRVMRNAWAAALQEDGDESLT